MSYTEEEVLKYLKRNFSKTTNRARGVLDPRDYLLGILYYKYGWTEEELIDLLTIKNRSTINNAKNKPYWYLKYGDESFLKHTATLRKMFPYVFPVPDKGKPKRKDQIKSSVFLTIEEHEEFLKYCADTNQPNIRVALKGVITDFLKERKKWE